VLKENCRFILESGKLKKFLVFIMSDKARHDFPVIWDSLLSHVTATLLVGKFILTLGWQPHLHYSLSLFIRPFQNALCFPFGLVSLLVA
jgi:hypothetical protein